MLKLTLLDEALKTLDRNLSTGLLTQEEMVWYVMGYLHSRGVPLLIDEVESFVLDFVNKNVEF